jgi:hypothetical protein
VTAVAASAVVDQLHHAGLHVALNPDGGLAVSPARNLTDELRGLIRAHKAALMDWLRVEAANDASSWRVYVPPGTSPATLAKFRAASLALDASQAYYDHHPACPTCIAAGLRYGSRCEVGAGLWGVYNG